MLEQQVSKDDVKIFNEALQKQNEEYQQLLQSREYRLGSAIIRTIECLLHLKIKSIQGYIKSIRVKNSKKNIYYCEKEHYDSHTEDNYFSSERIAVYTSIFGSYDSVKEPILTPSNIDYYIITDQTIPDNSIWTKIEADIPDELSPADKNRFVKMHPHLFFPEYTYSIYVDGSVKIVADLTPLIWKIGNTGIAVHRHSQRNCLYDELEYAIYSYKLTKNQSNYYKKYVEDKGMPQQYGLCECGVIARKHNGKACKEIMGFWWEQFQQHIQRDQISFPYVLYEWNIAVDEVCTLGNNIYRNKSFRIDRHS